MKVTKDTTMNNLIKGLLITFGLIAIISSGFGGQYETKSYKDYNNTRITKGIR